MTKPYKLALMMIVKNEANIIADTIDIICHNFSPDYWVISDTGSIDNTKEIIKHKMNEKNMPGHFADREWKDFSTNRNHVLSEAVKYAEYVITFDADDGVEGSFTFPALEHDMYRLRMLSGCASYYRPFILSTKKKWKWIGVLHEYVMSVDGHHTFADIEGNYFVRHNRVQGSRSSQDNLTKFSKDGDLLAAAIQDPDTPSSMIPRYTYYAGQSYRDAGLMDKAKLFFERTTQINGGWSEEKYLAAMELARYAKKYNNYMQALTWYGMAGNFSPTRVEWAMESAKILETSSKRMALGVLTSISADKVADPDSGNYFLLDISAHILYFTNKILFLAADCGRHDIVPLYLEMQAKRAKWLTNKQISDLESNIAYFSFICGEDALQNARNILSSHTIKKPLLRSELL